MTATVPGLTPKTAPVVRGACPALASPMMTGDGLLARIGLDYAISPADLVRIGALARAHGNGLIDISARGNFQVRGLSAASARALEEDVRRLNLPLRDGVPVETGVLAGLDRQEVADPRPLAAGIRDFIDEFGLSPRLAAKFAVVVEGGGQLPLHGLLADIRLVAVRREPGLFWRMSLGGTAGSGRVVGLVPDADAKTCATLVISRIAAMDVPVRGRTLDPVEVRGWLGGAVVDDDEGVVEQVPMAFGFIALSDGADDFIFGRVSECERQAQPISPLEGEMSGRTEGGGLGAKAAFDTLAAPPIPPSVTLVTSPPQGGRSFGACRIGIPFGQCPAETLIALGRQAQAAGIESLRPAIDHSLVFFGNETACRAMIEFSQDLIICENDARSRIAACPGMPACNSASIDTHALGKTAARDVADLLDGSFTLHLSGCAKGCAHPAKALVGLVGMNDRTALIFGGKTSDMPLTSIDQGQEASALANLAALVRLERGKGETTRDCLNRLGSAQVARAFSQGPL